MLLHQKMKLQREENRLTLEQMRFSSKVDRMEKKTAKRQKYYDKLKKQLERQANCYKNSMNMVISNQFGLGANSINLGNPYASNGAAQAMIQNMSMSQIQQMLGDKAKITEPMYEAIQKGCTSVATSDIKDPSDNTKVLVPQGALYNPFDPTQQITGLDSKAAQTAGGIYSFLQQQANMQITQMQSQATQMKQAYENNVSIWLEAQQEQVEAQEEWEMDLLAEEQADMEADKNMVEAKLKRVQQEKQNIEQALGQAIQDSAPKFGLG